MQVNKPYYYLIIFLICIPSILLRVWNGFNFNLTDGFDAVWHLEYILHLANRMGFPEPDTNLEFYQPPLYYFIGSVLFSAGYNFGQDIAGLFLKGFSTILAFLHILCCIYIYKKFCGMCEITFLFVLSFLFYLPMNIYISPMVGNEMLCSILIALSLAEFFRTQRSFSSVCALRQGVIIGLALLTKYTGFIAFINIIAVCIIHSIIKNFSYKIMIKFLAVFCFTVFIICGWWYARNVYLYGDPFIKSNDLPQFRKIYEKQPPGKRLIKDIISFDGSIFSQPFLALDGRFNQFYNNKYENYNTAFNNIPAGTFATAWVENHGIYKKLSRNFNLAKWLLILAVIPTAAIFFGLFKKNILFIPYLLLFILNIGAYVWYNSKYPYFCHVKGFFLTNVLPVVMLSFSFFMAYLKKMPKLLLLIFGINFVAVNALVIYLYFLK